MMRVYCKIGFFVLIACLLAGCSWKGVFGKGDKYKPGSLRIGVTANYPPLVFKTYGKLLGAEVDLARLLGQALGTEIEFIEERWEDLVPALYAGKVDLIMSGMSTTEARRIRINFTEPYLKMGLLAAMRSEDAPKYTSRERILNASSWVGVMENTTGDVFVQRNLLRANRIAFQKIGDAAFALKQRKIELFIHDAPAVAWMISENEASFQAHWELLNEEHLAWGIRYDDEELLEMINAIIKSWKADGTLDRVLNRWLPYVKRLNK